MTLDHVNKFVFSGDMQVIPEISRTAFPLFSIILAYNLARPTTNKSVFHRVFLRLFVCAVVSTPLFCL